MCVSDANEASAIEEKEEKNEVVAHQALTKAWLAYAGQKKLLFFCKTYNVPICRQTEGDRDRLAKSVRDMQWGEERKAELSLKRGKFMLAVFPSFSSPSVWHGRRLYVHTWIQVEKDHHRHHTQNNNDSRT